MTEPSNEIYATILGIVKMQAGITITKLCEKLNTEHLHITIGGVRHLLEEMESECLLHFTDEGLISLL